MASAKTVRFLGDDERSMPVARIDFAHRPAGEEAAAGELTIKKVQPRPIAVRQVSEPQWHEPESMQTAPAHPITEIEQSEHLHGDETDIEVTGDVSIVTARHAEDLFQRLAEKSRRIDERADETAAFEERLHAARNEIESWVMERDRELTLQAEANERLLEELQTRSAAIAAGEIASEREIQLREKASLEKSRLLERREEELIERERRLVEETAAFHEACERRAAQRRIEEESLRAARQKHEAAVLADRDQAERLLAQIERYRRSCDEREKRLELLAAELRAAEMNATDSARSSATSHTEDLDAVRARSEALRAKREALESRWIATQMWHRLASQSHLSTQALETAANELRRQLAAAFAEELAAVQEARRAVSRVCRETLQRETADVARYAPQSEPIAPARVRPRMKNASK